MVGRKRVTVKKGGGSLALTLLVLVVGGAMCAAFAYVLLCGRCRTLAGEIRRMEDQAAEIHRRVLNEEYKWSNLCTLKRVREQLAVWNIAMDWPSKEQVVHLTRPLDPGEVEAPPAVQVARRGVNEAHE